MKFPVILLLTCILAGCSSKKNVINQEYTSRVVDSTGCESESTAIHHRLTDVSNDKDSVCKYVDIEFTDSGGNIEIGTTGAIILSGVKHIAQRIAIQNNQSRAISLWADSMIGTRRAFSHSSSDTTSTSHRQSEVASPRRWYDTILSAIGAICCIAVLLWVFYKKKF